MLLLQLLAQSTKILPHATRWSAWKWEWCGVRCRAYDMCEVLQYFREPLVSVRPCAAAVRIFLHRFDGMQTNSLWYRRSGD